MTWRTGTRTKDQRKKVYMEGPACLEVQPLDLHVVSVGSIPTGPTHGEV